jgi:hypothetical protein
MPYCGAHPSRRSNPPPSAADCAKQIRLFGRFVHTPREGAGRLTDYARWRSGADHQPIENATYCGAKRSDKLPKTQRACSRNHRLYGLLPIVETRGDVEGIVSGYAADYPTLPATRFLPQDPKCAIYEPDRIDKKTGKVARGGHPFSRNLYEKATSAFTSANPVLISVVSTAVSDAQREAARDTLTGVGFIGFLLGDLQLPSRGRGHVEFHMLQFYVALPYRKSGVSHLVWAAARDAITTAVSSEIQFTIHTKAGCLLEPSNIKLFESLGFEKTSAGRDNVIYPRLTARPRPDLRDMSFRELQALCKKHKPKNPALRCGGKGVTKQLLAQSIADVL